MTFCYTKGKILDQNEGFQLDGAPAEKQKGMHVLI